MTFRTNVRLGGNITRSGRDENCVGFPFTLALVLALAWALAGCGDSKEIKTLKNGKLDMCPGITLGTMISKSMQRVRWESGTAEDGLVQVDIIGLMSVGQKPVTARLEFFVDESADSYRFGAFKLDDVIQEGHNAASLFSSMCEIAGGGPAPEAGNDGGQ